MSTSTRSSAAWTAAAAALVAAQVGLATSAAAKCKGDVCLVLQHSSDPASVNVSFASHHSKVVQFNMQFLGQTMAIPAHVLVDGSTSPTIQLPRKGQEILAQVCFGNTAPSKTCGTFQHFNLPGPWVAVATGSGHYGYSMGRTTQSDATNRALLACPVGACESVTASIGTCFSYARSKADHTIGAASIGNSVNEVEAAALKSCSALASGSCSIRRTKCR